ncbi:Uncharacterised protein [Vibrio cholerae]|nr:Uncharacterised protein [Vibrio cholerae]
MRSTGALSASLFSSANETGGSNCPSMIASTRTVFAACRTA